MTPLPDEIRQRPSPDAHSAAMAAFADAPDCAPEIAGPRERRLDCAACVDVALRAALTAAFAVDLASLLAHVEELDAELDRKRADWVDAIRLAHQFEAQVATLREALEPFAEMAKDWEGSDFSYGVPVADLEHARAALAATPAAERPE